MSPEQADPASGSDVDSRADIYSLGVMLYELVTGSPPFDDAAFEGRPLSQVQRMLREEDPATPSSRITGGDPTSAEMAERRRSDVRALRGELRGDLDWITMKALEKDRSRRYASASELAADVERHLNHEPTLAGPPGVGYRIVKFTRRHRVGVVAGSFIALTLIVGLVLATWGLVQASEERNQAREARDDAQWEAARAERILAFLTREMLGRLTPEGAAGQPISVKQMLDTAGSRIDESFANDPVARRRLHRCVAEAYRGLGYVHEAAAHYRTAGPGGDGVDSATRLLNEMQEAVVFFRQVSNTGRNAGDAARQGWAFVDKALAAFNRLSPGLGDALDGLRQIYVDRATHEKVWPSARASCTAAVEADPRTARPIGFALCFFASAAHVNTVPDPGIPLVRKALEFYKRALPPTHPQFVEALLQLSLLELDAGHRKKAFKILDSVPGGTLGLPEDSPARSLIVRLRAVRLAYDGDFDAAESMLLALLARLEQAVGSRSATHILVTLKWLYDSWDRPDDAAVFRKRYLDVTCEGRGGFLPTEIRWFFDRENPELAAALRRVAFLSWSGEDGLVDAFEEVLRLTDATLDDEDAARYLVGRALGSQFVRWRLDADSRPALVRQAAVLIHDHDRQPPETWLNSARRFINRGRGEEVIPFLEELLAHPKAQERLDPDLVAETRVALAEALVQAGRNEKAEVILEELAKKILSIAEAEQVGSAAGLQRAPWLLVALPESPRRLRELAHSAALALKRLEIGGPALERTLALACVRLDRSARSLRILAPANGTSAPVDAAIRVLALHRLGRHDEARTAAKVLFAPQAPDSRDIRDGPGELTWVDRVLFEEARSLVSQKGR